MTIAASQGVIGWAPQAAKGTLGTDWKRHKAITVAIGTQQDIQQFPPEVGGGFHPTGAYKRMAFGAGQVVMHPRLQDVIGWLLFAGVGSLSTISGNPEASMFRHLFTPPDDFCDFGWMSVRKEMPAGCDAGGSKLGEMIMDARVAGLRFSTAAGDLAQCAATFVGREPSLSDTDVDDWTDGWDNTYEHFTGVPTSSASDNMTIGTDSMKATNIVVDLTNQFTAPEEELIIGSYHPDDMILQQQILSVQWTYKWEDPDLYKAIVTGTNTESLGKIDWSPTVHTDSATIRLKTPDNATGMSNPWAIEFYAEEFSWQAAGPPVLEGGGWVSMDFMGVAQEQATGDTFHVALENLTSAYTWPT